MKNELLSGKARYRKGASILERWQDQMREGLADARLVLVRISGLSGLSRGWRVTHQAKAGPGRRRFVVPWAHPDFYCFSTIQASAFA